MHIGLTFKQFLLEYEFHIPKTSYGYWIDDTGKFISVDHSGHPRALNGLDILKQAEQERYRGSVYTYVFSKGWVRIIDIETDYDPNLNVDISIEFNMLTPRSHGALLAFLKDREKRRTNADMISIYVDATGTQSRGEVFHSFRDATRHINIAWNDQT